MLAGAVIRDCERTPFRDDPGIEHLAVHRCVAEMNALEGAAHVAPPQLKRDGAAERLGCGVVLLPQAEGTLFVEGSFGVVAAGRGVVSRSANEAPLATQLACYCQ